MDDLNAPNRWPAIQRRLALGLLVFLSLALLGYTCAGGPAPQLPKLPTTGFGDTVDYRADVEPVLEARCVACHACYDAPCQLLASSYEGIERGATDRVVYDGARLRQAAPTRLGLDAESVEEWRERDFHSVVESRDGRRDHSLLLNMLSLGRAHPFAENEKLPEELPLDINRSLTCPTGETFEDYARKQPMGGMPYGTAPLTDDEIRILASWVMQGATAPDTSPPLSAAAAAEVRRWETFLNGDSLKERITARYLYEHWVFAHLHFDDVPDAPFFRIVRSTTPPGESVVKIATRRPYDDPGAERFWYRLTAIESSIVHKTHIVYPLNDAKLSRLKQLFLASDWEPTRFPEYGAEASNPFTTFEEVPARSRYEFLLDDSRYFIMTFIRGPVCRGQVAVDVIQDHFFVAFLDPDRDPSVTDPAYLEQTKHLLNLPAENEGRIKVGGLWARYAIEQKEYLDARAKYYDGIDPKRIGPALDWIWDGDGHNRSALLTVFRHFDNANVRYGWIGRNPKTAWVMDFPVLERLYYDLVANFDVFGNVSHQASTRLYMDHLRMQSETLYLEFLPPEQRKRLRASWYVDATRDLTFKVANIRTTDHGTQIEFQTEDPHTEFIDLILRQNAAVAGDPDRLNRCSGDSCDLPSASSVEKRSDDALRSLVQHKGGFVTLLPDLTLLRVRSNGADSDAVYSIVHNRSHTNVAAMFGEDSRLEPEKDSVTLIRGYTGSYPNFAFDVPVDQIREFTDALEAATEDAAFTAVVERWGVRRSSADFWSTLDFFNADFRRLEPVEAGLLDINRYENL